MNHILPPKPPAAGRSAMGVLVLTGALVFSLLLNATLGILIQDQRGQLRTLQDRVESLERGGGDPAPPAQDDGLIGEIAADVERLRELRFRTEVEPEFMDARSLAARVRELFDESTSRDEFEATERVLATLGVVEAGGGLWDAFVAAHEEQVGGFYDEESKELVVLADEAQDLAPFSRILLAHELTHALTDQHFDLAEQREGGDDAEAAFLALVEGDATLLMSLYAQTVLTPAEQAEAALGQGETSTEALDRLPPFIQQGLLFPYTGGLDFVRALYEDGGFAAIDAAYADPPTTTEEILHPELYLAGAPDPRAPSLRGVRPALGDGWRRIDAGEVGEIDVRHLADFQIASGGLTAQESRAAADGWAGGRYAGFSDGDRTLVAIKVAYDSGEEAAEAASLFDRWLPLRFGNIGERMAVEGSASGWRSDEGAGIVARDGDDVIVVLGPAERPVRRAYAGADGS